jgi:hypothetical protein
MAFASHLGPWLLGTVKNTTGTTAGSVRNMGATVVAQAFNIGFADINASLTGTFGALPAGALITNVQINTTVVFSSATTLKLTIAGTDVNTASTITTVAPITVAQSATFLPIGMNVGTTDALITYTATGTALTTGAATVVISYIVRNSDGSQNPTAQQQ